MSYRLIPITWLPYYWHPLVLGRPSTDSAVLVEGKEKGAEKDDEIESSSLVAQPKEDGGLGIQPFGNYNRALNGMEIASWMETNKKKYMISN